MKLNLLEEKHNENNIENNKENEYEINDKNDFDLNDENLKIEEQKIDKNEDDDFDDFKKDWVIYENEEALSVNLNENEEKEDKNENNIINEKIENNNNDLFNDYEIIENFNEKDENVATSKKVEV